MKKFTGISVRSEMYIFAKDAGLLERMMENPPDVLMDIAMTI
jgi:hypothetical protein